MKQLRIMLLALTMFLCSSVVLAQGVCPLNVFSEKTGKITGMIMTNGTMHNEMGKIIVEMINSRIFDSGGHKIGLIADGKVMNARGIRIGSINRKGVMKKADGTFLGRIDDDGLVRRRNGTNLYMFDGWRKEVPQCRKFVVAWMFFFRERR